MGLPVSRFVVEYANRGLWSGEMGLRRQFANIGCGYLTQTYTAQITQRAANAIMDAITIRTDTLRTDPLREPPNQSS